MTIEITTRPRTTTADLRRQNLASAITLLHRHGPLQRTDITEATGLNKSTVLSLVDELVQRGLVTEEAAVPDGSRGRPSAVVTPNSAQVVVIASEIAVDHARIAAVGLGGTVFKSAEVDIHPAEDGPNATSRALGAASVDLLAERPSVVGVGTAIHGLVTLDGHLVEAPNIGWSDLDLHSYGREMLPREIPLLFGNDAHLGALAEHRRGSGHKLNSQDLLYLSAERGIGGGLIRDGERQTGRNDHATEIGHLVVNRHGSKCKCGSHGCLETEIGELALLRKARRPRVDRISAERVIEDAAVGDSIARSAVEDVASWLGFGIGNLVNVCDPGLVVCGGFLAGIHRLAAETVENEARAVIVASQHRNLNIVGSALGPDAALVGAAELVFDHVLRDPAALISARLTRASA